MSEVVLITARSVLYSVHFNLKAPPLKVIRVRVYFFLRGEGGGNSSGTFLSFSKKNLTG